MPAPYLTTQELAAKYPMPAMANANKAWYRLTMRWRDQGKLKLGEHWKYSFSDGCRTRRYLEIQVLKLLWASDSPFCEEVRSVHRSAILATVKEAT